MNYLYLLLVACLCHPLSAQYEDGLKFGKVDDADRALMAVPGDSAAAAYVLYDKLDLRFDYHSDKGPVTVETFHRRVKLLKPSSFDRANVTLTYDRSYQDLEGINAEVHLPNGETIKLRNRDLVRQDLEGDRRSIAFTFPQITPGAIIEYEYTKRSESIIVPTEYTFQEGIPVRWAEYTARIPEYYRYVSLGTQGNFFIQEVADEHRRWNVSALPGANNTIPIRFSDMRFVMKDIPSFPIQPYTNNLSDYLPKVKLQLQSVEYPNQIPQPIFNNWMTTVTELHQRGDFGRAYQAKLNYNRLWREAEPVIMAKATAAERVAAAYYFVAGRINWNGNFSILGTETPDKVLANGSGNSADLNLCLLALLNEAGITAHPLLVSLRDHGTPMEMYPLINQFDHLMVYAEVDGGANLLDANGTERPPGLPRVDALNHRGWVADAQRPRWINVEVPQARRVVMADITVGAAGEAVADITGRMESYYAFGDRQRLKSMEKDSEAPLVTEIVRRFPEATVLEHGAVEDDSAENRLTYHAKLNLPAGMANEDYLYVQPILIAALDNELDDVDERQYPIDFPFPWKEQYVATVHIPEGYLLEAAPESIRMTSEDGGITATFTTHQQPDQTMIINFSVDLDRTFYRATDYPALRDMYRRIIELQETMLVFKRAK